MSISAITAAQMVLDALTTINDQIDPTLSFRRSCREGVCGSCAMNIDGQNRLACLTPMDELKKGTSRITPLPHMTVLKDLVSDPSGLYELIELWLQSDQPAPDRARRQSPEERAKLDGVHPVLLLLDLVPELLVEPGQIPLAVDPLQSYRWLADNRDQHTGERLDRLDDPFRLYRCHTIINCTNACPKGLNSAKAIANTKRMMSERS